MKSLLTALSLVIVLSLSNPLRAADAPAPDADGFYSLFDGKSLDGWKISTDSPTTFSIVDGCLQANGNRAHLFYDGPVANHVFKNFHLKAEVMTYPKANSGIYFHTEYQENGWPAKGFECQVNQTHSDPKKTGGLYSIKDVMNTSPVKDNEWYAYEIIVEGKHVVIKINGKITTDWTQPDDFKTPQGMGGRQISSGTVALQGHDPNSKVLYRNIKIKPLAD